MKNSKLKKETEIITYKIVKGVEVKFKTKEGRIISNYIAGSKNFTDKAIQKMKDVEILFVKDKLIKLQYIKGYWKDYINRAGFLATDDFQEDPTENELMKI